MTAGTDAAVRHPAGFSRVSWRLCTIPCRARLQSDQIGRVFRTQCSGCCPVRRAKPPGSAATFDCRLRPGAVHLDGLPFYPKYGLNAGVLLSRLDRLRRSDFTEVREAIIEIWGPGGRGLLYLGDQARCPALGSHPSCAPYFVPAAPNVVTHAWSGRRPGKSGPWQTGVVLDTMLRAAWHPAHGATCWRSMRIH